MNRTFWLCSALLVTGFMVGCGGSEMPTQAPAGDPAMENLDDASDYAVPDEAPTN